MRRLLFVDHVHRILGGAEVNLIELLEAAKQRDAWSVAGACPKGSPLAEQLGKRGIAQVEHRLPSGVDEFRLVGAVGSIVAKWKAWRAMGEGRRQLGETIRQYRPDCVITCTNKDALCAGAVCRSLGIPCIWWINDIISPDFFPWAVRKAFILSGRKDRPWMVTVSDFANRALVAEGADSARVLTIHNGIAAAKYSDGKRGSLREELSLPMDAPLAGIIGRFAEWKGQRQFIELARRVVAAGEPWHFVLVGKAFNEDQGFEVELRDMVIRLGLERRVHFAPFRERIQEVLVDLNVLIHASTRPEPFGRVIIEAMAAGVPVIAAAAGGVLEIIEEGVSGFLATPGEVGEYENQLARFSKDPELIQRIRVAARYRVATQFSEDRVYSQFEVLVGRACEGGKNR